MLSDSPHATPRLKRLAVRTAAVVCAIAVGFGLAGCGSSTAGTVTLDFFQFKSEAADQFKKMEEYIIAYLTMLIDQQFTVVAL